MAIPVRTVLAFPRGYRSKEAASFVAQLDELSGRLVADLAGVRRPELEWQPAPGMNTIGMLLAHIAIVEVWWTENAIREIPAPDVGFGRLIGIGMDGDGMPIPPRGRHPARLRGKSLAFYRSLLRRARANVRSAARRLTPRDIARDRRRVRRDGKPHVYNARWVLYHLVEHLGGHYGQILALRHAYRDRRKRR